jgi:predicted alpha-1,2-mannosidase
MNKKINLVLLFSFSICLLQAQSKSDLVNTLMGTYSKPDLSNGNTYPAIGTPWGMNYWTPQTGKNGDGWQYTYSGEKILGFKQTHQPSPWMNDYGQFSIMPTIGMKWKEADRASWFSHKAEEARPYYYRVYLADADITTELTATERAAQFQVTFPDADTSSFVIDAFDKGSYIKIIPAENKIIGYSTRYRRGKLINFKNYFVIYFDKPFRYTKTVSELGAMIDSLEITNSHALGVVGFKTRKGEKVNCRVASSFISFEQAELNLKELGDKTSGFDKIKAQTKAKWEKALGAIQVEGGTDEQTRTFYSCLYRAVMFPNKLYEIDANKQIVHYSPYNGKILPGYMYGGTGFWDTFRALYPLLNLVYPSINKEMQEGLINDYKEGGWLPEWSSPGYADIMIGNNSASVVSDAYIKGLRGYDIEKLYEALLHGANNEGPMTAVGRKGVEYYNRLGYVPYDVKINENAARTLEYAYDDFAIYQLAKALNRPKAEIDLYARRCLNYRNLFDPETKLMRGKNEDGKFQSPFNPVKWGDAFTEGNSWHYSWSVFHDVQGLIDLMGGKQTFVKMIDSVFSMAPTYDDTYYGGTIHEIREMQIAGMGQYAHGNQPIQHMIYLYNYAGQPWKTQYWSREVMNRMYKPTPDGYCGDEDNGQTSAWYIFSAMGFYPVCPATSQYVMGAPLFKKLTLNLENGKKLVIDAPQNSAGNKYIQSVTKNGTAYGKNWLDHFELMKGGRILINMSAKPNQQWGIADADAPYSFSRDKR